MSCPFCCGTGCDKCSTAAPPPWYNSDPIFTRYPEEYGEERPGLTVPPPYEGAMRTPPQQGWLCPACGCGNAPWVATCGQCKPKPNHNASSGGKVDE
jgi:hypothetical protein